jgi:hypothetical protein
MDSKKYNLEMDSEDEVSRLLTALPRVDAPSNFDFQVKARIASRKQPRSWIDRIPVAVRFALPTLLIMLVGAYVYFYIASGYTTPGQQGESVAGNPAPPTVDQPAAEPAAPVATSGELATQQGATPAPRGGTQDRVTSPNKQNSKVPQGGSKDFALDNPKSIGGNGAGDPRKAPGVGPNTSQLSVKQVLSPIGIDTVYENGGWKVLVVTANSPAMRSGIIKGDIVTAIGNQQLNQNSSFRKASAGQLTVMRAGKPVNIRVQPD